MAFFGKYFKVPFANSGDVATIPDDAQVDGSVSYTEGFGNDYELNPATDPQAKDIPRDQTNQLQLSITQALKWYQEKGFPQWIDSATNGGSAFSYAKGIIVNYPVDGKIYYSLVAANTATPGTDVTKWEEIGAGSFSTSGWFYVPGLPILVNWKRWAGVIPGVISDVPPNTYGATATVTWDKPFGGNPYFYDAMPDLVSNGQFCPVLMFSNTTVGTIRISTCQNSVAVPGVAWAVGPIA